MEKKAPVDWVAVRSQCSIAKVFLQLKLEVEADVDARNLQLGKAAYYGFSVVSHDASCFAVLLSGNGVPRKDITFQQRGDLISARNEKNEYIFEATRTLNDEGECRLKIDGKEREFWQARRMALEPLLFETVRTE